MNFSYSPYALPLIAAALISVAVIVYAWVRRSAVGATPLFLLAASIFVWVIGYALEIMGRELETKYFWGVFQYIGIAFSTYGWLMFSIVYSDLGKIITRRFIAWTVLIPSITVLLALTTKWNGLIWSEYHISRQNDFSALEVTHGFWFFVHFAYSYLILLIGTVLLLRALRRRKGMYRGQLIAMLIAVLAPWVGNALFLTGNSPIPYLDLTPFAFTVSVAAVAWAIFGFHLVDITPLARDIVVDSMRDGMIVLNVRGIVVDINSAAARMIGVPMANAIGKIGEDIFHPWADLVERFRNVMEARTEIVVGEGEAKRRYEVRLSPLEDQQGQLVGRVIMLRAIDNEEIPQARFAVREPISRPLENMPPDNLQTIQAESKNRLWNGIKIFFVPPINADLPVEANINPVWARTIERVFTILVRVVAVVGTASVAISLPYVTGLFIYSLSIIGVVGIFWALALLRSLPLRYRTSAFMLTIYGLAFLEIFNFGYSVETFTYFVSIVVFGVVLEGLHGGLRALSISLVTLVVFGLLISFGIHQPVGVDGSIHPSSLGGAIASVVTYLAAALALVMSINALMSSLNSSWNKETQALNLLQQERDLLEQRVEERTRDLVEARDQAIIISQQMRKYYRAIEQSGNTIVITDTKGNIEYVNPRFSQSTGYTIQEAIGETPRILKSGKQSAEYYSHLWKTISSGNIWMGEFLNKRKDGSLYWESATIAPVLDQNGLITNYVAVKEDVTARRQAEEQLRKLTRAVEQSGNTVIVMDKNGVIEYVNPKFTEVTGFSSEEALGKSPIALMNSLERVPDFSQDEWWLTVNAGKVWHGEFHNHRKNGSEFWESATIAPVLTRDGEAINFVEIKQDITEQKIMQDQLQKQNDYLSILHQITLDLLNRREINDLLQVIVDRSSILLDAPFSELMLEKDGVLVVESFTDNQMSLKGDRATREQAKLSWQAFDSRQPVVVEDYHSWENRRRKYDSLSLRAVAEIPVMAGTRCLGVLALARTQPDYTFTVDQIETGILFVRLVALVLDNAGLYDSAMKEIAERKHAESLLQESEARFRQIVENASDIIYRVDLKGNFTYANPSALKLMGYASDQEVMGINYLDLTVPEFRHKLKRVYDHQYLGKIKSTYYEFPAVTLDGQTIWVGQNVQLIMDGDQIVGFQAVARNITQLRQAQEALALSRDQALDASRFKSQLLSRVSHELRTPLGGILGYAELLEYKAFGPLNEDQHDAVSNIVESTHYLTSIVNDLLDESQIESKSISLHNEYFIPSELLEKTNTAMSTLAAKKGLPLRFEVGPDLPSELYGDVNRLQQILINLVGNAIKFTQAGEVSVCFKRPAPVHWSIEVHDTGAGIPMSDHQNIFEPFRQVSNSITRENRGSGLGLAITKQLIELMGGQISLESEIGKGSLFTVILPIINAPGE
jgi:PAS domain S-box-containing protein